MVDQRNIKIIEFIKKTQEASSREVFEGIGMPISYATVKWVLSALVDEELLIKKGQGKSTKYLISPAYEILFPVDLESYYE